MATVTRYVNTASTPGGDGTTNATAGANRAYASLSEWEAAEQTDLVAAGDIHKVICSGGELVDWVEISGWTTNASSYIVITVDPASRHNGVPKSGFYLRNTTDYRTALRPFQNYTKISHMDVHDEHSLGVGDAIQFDTVTGGTCYNTIARSLVGTAFYVRNGDTSVLVNFINCLAYDSVVGFDTTQYRGYFAYNCTAVENQIGFRRQGTLGATKATVRNCVAYNNSTSQFDNGGSGAHFNQTASSHNATSEVDTTNVPGSTGNIANIVSGDFADAANDDWSLASGSALAEAGVDLTTQFNGQDATEFDIEIVDMIGTTRPQSTNWDIGAFELVASTGYTLTAEPGSFTLSGVNADLLVGRTLTAETGSFTLSGIDAGLLVQRLLAAATGTFALTGNAINLPRSYLLAAQTGSFALTGNNADIDKLYILAAETGSFALTGFGVAFARAYVLDAETGTFTLTGSAVSFSSEGQLSVLPGSFVFTGNDAELRVNRLLTAETGSFGLSGQAAALLASRLISASPAAFVLTGYDIDFFSGSVLVAETGEFTLNGNDVIFRRALILDAETGSFVFTGIAADISYSAENRRLFTPRTGLFTKRR